jgi:hypothetical protein
MLTKLKTGDNHNEISRKKKRTDTAELKRLSQRLIALDRTFKDYSINDVDVKLIDGRIQVFFQGKPCAEIRSKLKSYPLGLKWSRYSTAWVRKFTANTGRHFFGSLNAVLKEI